MIAIRFPLPTDIRQRVIRLPGAEVAPGARRSRTQAMRQRREQFEMGRALAAELLHQSGAPTVAVGMEADRAPKWPCGFVGSISHTRELLGVAVARDSSRRAIGIDVEAIVGASALDAVRECCIGRAEESLLARAAMPAEAATLCFSAKEALFKCLYPLVRRYFDFRDAEVVELDISCGHVAMRLGCDLSCEFRHGTMITGSVTIIQGHVLSAFALPAPAH